MPASVARLDIVETERGAHTIGFDPETNHVYAFLRVTHRSAVFATSRDHGSTANERTTP